MCKDKASKRVRQTLFGKFTWNSPIPGEYSASIQHWLLRAGSETHTQHRLRELQNASWVLPHQTKQIVTHENAAGCQKQFFYFCPSLLQYFPALLFPQCWWCDEEKWINTLIQSGNKIAFHFCYFLLKYNYGFAFVMLFIKQSKGWKQNFGHWLLSLWGTGKIQEDFIQGFCFVSFFSHACPSLKEDQAFPCAGRLIRW